MKKQFVFILSFLFVFSLFGLGSVFASDKLNNNDDPLADRDDQGHYTAGFFDYKEEYSSGTYRVYHFETFLGYFYVKDNGVDSAMRYLLVGSSSARGYCTRTLFNADGTVKTLEWDKREVDLAGSAYGWANCNTNFPIFTNQTDIDNYINNGDDSSASNKDQIKEKSDYDENVEDPLNLTVKNKSSVLDRKPGLRIFKDITFVWEQTKNTKDYYFLVQYYLKLSHEKNEFYTDKYLTAAIYYDGESIGNYNLSHTQLLEMQEKAEESQGLKKNLLRPQVSTVDSLYFVVWNVDKNTKKRSRLVTYCVDWKNNTTEYYKTKEEAGEKEEYKEGHSDGGNGIDQSVESDNGNIQILINNNPTFNNDVTVEGSKSFKEEIADMGGSDDEPFDKKVGGVKEYINDGFGLLGDSGIFGLMASLISYLPGSFWTLLITAVGLLVIIMIVGVILEVI